MKNFVLLLFIGLMTNTFAQNTAETPKIQTIEIRTSAICGECKERIENSLNYTKGVVYAELDLETNIITIKYKTKHVTKAQIKQVISKVGYHADDVERDAEAFNALPNCCRDKDAKCSKVE